MMSIKIQPEIDTEAYVLIKQLEHFGFEFSGPGFWAGTKGFYGLLHAQKGDTWYRVECSGCESPIFNISTNQESTPDPCDEARDYADTVLWAEQPTPYDP